VKSVFACGGTQCALSTPLAGDFKYSERHDDVRRSLPLLVPHVDAADRDVTWRHCGY